MLLPDNIHDIFELEPFLIIIAKVDYSEPCLQKALDVYSGLMIIVHMSYVSTTHNIVS